MVERTHSDRRSARRDFDADAFSASQARVRSARAYVCWVKPAILVLVSLLTVVQWALIPDAIPVAIWIALGGFWTVQFLWIALVRAGVDPLPVAGLSLVFDALIEFAAMFTSAEPVGASATMTFFIVAASYFLRAWITMMFAIACAVGITVASRVIDRWSEGYAVPSTAFIALITGVLCAFIMSRVRRTEQRLERVAEDERAARERLEQVDASRDRLIANVSHELRTPLTATIGSIETLLREDVHIDEASRDRLMLVARDGGLRLLSLVEDLLTLGATRPDSLELDAGTEHLAKLVADAIIGIDPGDGRAIRIDVRQDPAVRVDRLRMLQVIGNLATNGVRHGRGDVVIETALDGDEAVVRVLDDGRGVEPAHEGELFLPFARFSTRTDSTGLGLAICRTIVEAHGGSIRYERTEDDRTCFTVRLPLEAVPAPARG